MYPSIDYGSLKNKWMEELMADYFSSLKPTVCGLGSVFQKLLLLPTAFGNPHSLPQQRHEWRMIDTLPKVQNNSGHRTRKLAQLCWGWASKARWQSGVRDRGWKLNEWGVCVLGGGGCSTCSGDNWEDLTSLLSLIWLAHCSYRPSPLSLSGCLASDWSRFSE